MVRGERKDLSELRWRIFFFGLEYLPLQRERVPSGPALMMGVS